jgi:3-dehydroquinate synthase class II
LSKSTSTNYKSTYYIILNCLDWRVIPIENLIARTRGKSKLIAEVSNAEDAQLVLEALELGTDGVLLKTSNLNELIKTATIVKKQTQTSRASLKENAELFLKRQSVG